MKWIIILATVLSCATPFSYADDDMPVGDTTPVENTSGWGSPSSTSAPKLKAKPKADKTMPKGTDYAPAQDLLLSAMSLIGVKYTWGGNTPESGLDCSGFIKYVFQNSMNITLPRTAFEMAHTGQTVEKTELKPGDLVFFNTLGRTFSHVGIYLGDNRFIHSPRAGRSVEVANMAQSYWQNRFNGGRRVADSSGSGLNVNAMLAASNNSRSPAPIRSGNDAEQPQSQCKKVTVGKGKKKKTVLQCTKPRSGSASERTSGKKTTATKTSTAKKNTATKAKTTTAKSSKTAKPATTKKKTK